MKKIKLTPAVCYGLVGGLSYAAFHHDHSGAHLPPGTTAQSLPISIGFSDGTGQFSNVAATPSHVIGNSFKGPVAFYTGAQAVEHPADAIWQDRHGFTSEG